MQLNFNSFTKEANIARRGREVGTNAGNQNMLDPSNHLNLIPLDIVSLTSLAFHRVWVVDVTSRSSLTL